MDTQSQWDVVSSKPLPVSSPNAGEGQWDVVSSKPLAPTLILGQANQPPPVPGMEFAGGQPPGAAKPPALPPLAGNRPLQESPDQFQDGGQLAVAIGAAATQPRTAPSPPKGLHTSESFKPGDELPEDDQGEAAPYWDTPAQNAQAAAYNKVADAWRASQAPATAAPPAAAPANPVIGPPVLQSAVQTQAPVIGPPALNPNAIPGMEQLGGLAPGPAKPPALPPIGDQPAEYAAGQFQNPRTGRTSQGGPLASGLTPAGILNSPITGGQQLLTGLSESAAPAEAAAADMGRAISAGQGHPIPGPPDLSPELLKQGAAGATKVIGGAMELAAPLVPAGAAIAPAATAATIALSAATQTATDKLLQSAGVPPEYAGFAGAVAGMLTASYGAHEIYQKAFEAAGSPEIKIGGTFAQAKDFADMTDEELVAHANAIERDPPKNYDWQKEEIVKEVLTRQGRRTLNAGSAQSPDDNGPSRPPASPPAPVESTDLPIKAGGASAPVSETNAPPAPPIDYAALAKQAGLTTEPPNTTPDAAPTLQTKEDGTQLPPITTIPPQNLGGGAAAPEPQNSVAATGETHAYSSTQLNLPDSLAQPVRAFAATIPKDQLSDKTGEGEETPHVTLAYGNPGTDPAPFQKLLKDEPPITATLGKASVFHTDDGDVLKVAVESPDLHRLNSIVTDAVDHTGNSFPTYQPHVTIAYLKKGEGDQYDGKAIPGVTGQQVQLNSVRFSAKDGQQTDIPLMGKQQDNAVKPSIAEQNPAADLPLPPISAAAPSAENESQPDAAFEAPANTPLERTGVSAPQPQPPTAPPGSTESAGVHDNPSQGEPGWVGNIPTSEIKADPTRFQFKQNVGQGGAGEELRSVTKWNPVAAGTLAVWKDPADNQTYAVNGHNRLALANRLDVPQTAVRYMDASDAHQAMVEGALANISEGRGDPTDAARIFRDSNMTPADIENAGISLSGKLASQGMALANLSPKLFNAVTSGDLPVERGAVIGAGVPNQADQESLYDLIQQREKAGKRPTNDQLQELIRLNNSSPTITGSSEDQAQGGLFGAREMKRTLLPEKAEISDYIRKQLGAEKKLFSTVGTQGAAEKLGETGNVIQTGANAAQALQANQGQVLYDKVSRLAGPIDDILNRAAKSLAKGEPDAKQRAYKAARTELTRQLGQLTGVQKEGPGPVEGHDGQGPSATGAGQPSATDTAPEVAAPNFKQGDKVQWTRKGEVRTGTVDSDYGDGTFQVDEDKVLSAGGVPIRGSSRVRAEDLSPIAQPAAPAPGAASAAGLSPQDIIDKLKQKLAESQKKPAPAKKPAGPPPSGKNFKIGDRVQVNLHTGKSEGFGTVEGLTLVDGKPGYRVRRDNGEVRELKSQDVDRTTSVAPAEKAAAAPVIKNGDIVVFDSPQGSQKGSIVASYKDGTFEVRIPAAGDKPARSVYAKAEQIRAVNGVAVAQNAAEPSSDDATSTAILRGAVDGIVKQIHTTENASRNSDVQNAGVEIDKLREMLKPAREYLEKLPAPAAEKNGLQSAIAAAQSLIDKHGKKAPVGPPGVPRPSGKKAGKETKDGARALLEEARHASKANEIWHGLTPIEQKGIAFGLFPHAPVQKAVAEGYDNQKIAAALMSREKSERTPANPFASAADAERERLRQKFGTKKKEGPTPLQSRAVPTVDPEDLMGLATIGMQHMVDGAAEYNEWTQRVMADVGDLVDAIAHASNQTPQDLLREVHGYAAAAVNSMPGHNIAPAPPANAPSERTGPGVSNAAPEPTAPGFTEPAGANGLVNAVYEKLKAGESLGNITKLTELAEQHFGASRTSGQWSPKDAFDAMEAGVNKYLLDRGKELMAMDPIKGLAELRKLMDRITSQASVRTEDQIANQQFSTPPTESYVVARVADLKPTDVVLEPSAGNGGLAVWPKAIGAEVHVNEISARRGEMLQGAGIGTPTTHDGELINALLDTSIQPSVVLMNPPFSASTQKSHEAKNRSQYGFNHVDQALQRLAPNGRLVVILGGGQANDTNGGASLSTGPSGKWFEKIAQQYNVRANIRISGKEYQKYGTTFATRIIVIDKDGPTPSQTQTGPKTWNSVKQGNADTLEEAYNLLSDVAATRPQVELEPRSDNGAGEREPGPGLASDQNGVRRSDPGLRQRGGGTGEDGQPAGELGVAAGGHGKLSPDDGSQLPGGVEPGTEPAGHPEPASPNGTESGAENADDQRAAGLELERNEQPAVADSESEADNGPFVPYHPTLAGPDHPGAIVETRTMATVPMPAIAYRPSLPESVFGSGGLSAVQMEAIAIMGQQNSIVLPNGAYSTALIGDGTGVGKGRIAAGILWDNYRQGRKRLVFVTEKLDLLQDIIRDLRGIGATDLLRGVSQQGGQNVIASDAAIKNFGKFKGGQDVKHDGILFSTYALARSEDSKAHLRSDQLERYLRGDDGGEGAYLLMDEAHGLKNTTGASQSITGQRFKALIDNLPHLRTGSLSATAATDVNNLGYLDRMGLWGPGTAFPQGFGEFQSQLAPGGIAAMEMIAREWKAQGKYVSRTLSFKGVTYSQEKHELTPEQKDIYKTASTAWKSVMQSVEHTIANTTNGGTRQTARFMSNFASTQQRFFNLLISALKTPTAIELANKALADGKSVVITLVNTNEAAQNREKSKERDRENDSDEPPDYDFGPKEMLVQLVKDNYPIQQFADDVDSDGKPIKVPMYTTDGQGRKIPVVNPTAVAARDALVARINRDLHMPENPLDILLNSLGGESKVAEITGRKEKYDQASGKFVKRGDPKAKQDEINLFEMRAFQDGKKRVAILSSSGGTGISLHAANDAKNQQPRYHITLQVGWSADKAMQMLGRTHRTNQAHAPHYAMLTSDLGGEQRFVSTIARRLGSLGALTKGQKNAAGGSAVADNANIETDEGRQATNSFYGALLRNTPVPGTGLTGMQILTDLRVLKLVGGALTVPPADRTNVTRLLNRLLALEPDVQNPTYKYFFNIFEAAVHQAEENGTLDTGVKTLPGDEFHVKEQRAIAKDPKTGAETFYYPVDAKIRTDRVSPEEVDKRMMQNQVRHPQILRSLGGAEDDGKLLLAMDAQPIVSASGTVTPAFHYARPDRGQWVKIPQVQLLARRFQEVGAWANAEVSKAKFKADEAQRGLDRDRKELDRATADAREPKIREAQYDLRDAQKRVDDFAQHPLAADPQIGPSTRARLADQLERAKANAAAAQQYELPASHWRRGQLTESEKNLAAAQQPLATAEAIAKNPHQWAMDRWKEAYEAAPTHLTVEHHLIGGAVMKYWNPIRDAAHVRDSIYTTADSKTGQRVVGIDIPPTHIRALLDKIGGGKSTVDAAQLATDVIRNNMTYTLEGNIQVRRGRVGRENVIQMIPPSQDVARTLTGMGVISERGVSPVYYVPNNYTGPYAQQTGGILGRVMEQYPVKPEDAPAPLQSRALPEDTSEAVKQRSIEQLQADPQGFVDRYRARFGDHFNPDNAAELFPDYSASPEARAKYRVAVSMASGWVADEAFKQRLAEPDKTPVVFTAGGTASGKSTTIAGPVSADGDIVFDSTFSNYDLSKQRVQEALDSGRKVEVRYVYRDPMEAWAAAKVRAANEGAGRSITPKAHAATHSGAASTVARLAGQFSDNAGFHIKYFELSAAKGMRPGGIELTRKGDYTDLRERLEQYDAEHTDRNASETDPGATRESEHGGTGRPQRPDHYGGSGRVRSGQGSVPEEVSQPRLPQQQVDEDPTLQSRALPGDQSLFSEDEEGESRTSAQLHEDKLLGDQLTAQIKSGLAAKPAKLKKAQNRGLFDDEEAPEQTSLFSRAMPGFYSQLERTIEAKMPARALPQQVIGILDNPQNGVKPDERKWTDIDAWLKDQKGPITKQAVLDYLKANEVRVEEVTKGKDVDRARVAELSAELKAAKERARSEEGSAFKVGDRVSTVGAAKGVGSYSYSEGRIYEAQRNKDGILVWKNAGSFGGTRSGRSDKFIRELKEQAEHPWLATAYHNGPVTQTQAANAAASEAGRIERLLETAKSGTGVPTKYQKWKPPGGSNYREVLLTLPVAPNGLTPHELTTSPWWRTATEGDRSRALADAERRPHISSTYQSPHWSERNVVAHIRMIDYTLPDGQRVAVMLENQSDWHEAGRKKGYQPSGEAAAELKQQIAEADAAHSVTADAFSDAKAQYRELALAARQKGLDSPAFLKAFDALSAAERANGEAYTRVAALRERLNHGTPNAPFSKTWHELVFRRMLRHAVEGGYDKLAWTTGAQQAGLYNLAKSVDSIHYSKEAGRLWAVKDGKDILNQQTRPEDLPDFIGKELAERLLNSPVDEGSHDRQSLAGKNLKVGGEGMKGFYDQIIPQYAARYVKKWGATVGETKLPGVSQKVHTIDITPSMRESVMQGQPLFNRKANPDQLSLFGERSTSIDDLQKPARRASTFEVNPRDIVRIPDAPWSRATVPSAQQTKPYWRGAGFRKGSIGGRPAIFVNNSGMDIVLARMGAGGAGETGDRTLGLTLEPKEWQNILDAAAEASNDPRTGGFDKQLIQAAAQIRAALGIAVGENAPAGLNKPLIVVQSGPNMKAAVVKRVAEEEYDHAQQMELPGGLRGLPLESLETPAGQKAAAALARAGYPKLDPASKYHQRNRAVIAAEIGVRLMRPGRYEELGLTPQEALDLTKAHTDGLAKHGAAAGAIVDQLNETAEHTQTALETGLQARGGANQEAGAARSDRPGGVSPGAGKDVSGGQGQPGPIQSRNPFDFVTGDKDPDELVDNYSGLGVFKDKFVRNLSQLEKVSEKAHAAAVQAATSRAQTAALIRAAAPRIEASLGKDGPSFLDFRRALIESRLRGLRDRWGEMSREASNASDFDLRGAFGSWMAHLLKNIREVEPPILSGEILPGPPQSPAETAAALLERADFAGLRAFASNAFHQASGRVARMMPEEEYDRITGNAGFARGLQAYKKLLENPIARNHEENEGVFSTALGPLDTYYPLVPVTTEEQQAHKQPGRSGRAVPYRKPKNIANAFATGHSEAYDPGIEALEDRLRNAFRVNNKAALLETLQDTGLLKPLDRGEAAPDFITLRGVPYKAVKIEVKPDRQLITPKGSTYVPAQNAVIPAWLESELRPILDRKSTDLVDPKGILAKITQITLAGPADAAIHSANLMGTLVANTPFVGKSLAGKILGGNPLTKRFAALFQALTTDASTEDAAADIMEAAKLGLIPEKYGSTTYSRKYAEQTGAELNRHSFAPMLYGPNGIDIRARLVMYRLAKAINPDATPKEMYLFVNQLGNYTRTLQGRLERTLKESAISPFYTAGSTMVRNGVNAWTGQGPMPKGGKQLRVMSWLRGVGGLLALWVLIHKAYTGKFPWEDPHSKFLSIRLNDDDRKSWLARQLYGDPSTGDAYVGMGFFSPLAARGARALGIAGAYNTHQAGGSADQVMDSALAGAVDAAVQPVFGPPARMAWIGLSGTQPNVTGFRDDRGKPALQTSPLVKSQPPGALGFIKQHIVAPILSMNSFFSNVAAATGLSKGLMLDADVQGNHWLRMATDLATPLLAPRPSSELGQADFLARQRSTEREAPRVELKQQIADAIREKDIPKAKALVQQGARDGIITREDVMQAEKRATVPKTLAQFNSLPIDAALEVMQSVTPEEKATFIAPLAKRLYRDFPKLPEAERKSVIEQLTAAHITLQDLQHARQ